MKEKSNCINHFTNILKTTIITIENTKPNKINQRAISWKILKINYT